MSHNLGDPAVTSPSAPGINWPLSSNISDRKLIRSASLVLLSWSRIVVFEVSWKNASMM